MSEQVFEVEPSSSQEWKETKFSPSESVYQREEKPKKRGKQPKERKQWAQPQQTEQPQVITQEMLEPTIIGIMQTLGAVFDESFEVLDAKTGAKDPRVIVACAQMLPWAQKYGGVLLSAAPWLGLTTGLLVLMGPGLGATVEIAAGVRKPRIMRTSSEDVYTDKYKEAVQTVNGQVVSKSETPVTTPN